MISVWVEDDTVVISGEVNKRLPYVGRNKSIAPEMPEPMHVYFSTGFVVSIYINDDYLNTPWRPNKYSVSPTFYTKPPRGGETINYYRAKDLPGPGYSDLVEYDMEGDLWWVAVNQFHFINYSRGDWV